MLSSSAFEPRVQQKWDHLLCQRASRLFRSAYFAFVFRVFSFYATLSGPTLEICFSGSSFSAKAL